MEDSLKATAVYAETLLKLRVKKSFQNIKAGISADRLSISLLKHGDKRFVLFSAPFKAKNSVHPQDVFNHNSNFFWEYNWSDSLYYPLMIMSEHDSAGKNTMYAGYIQLLRENKWKLIASVSVKNAPKFIGKIDMREISDRQYISHFSNKWFFRSGINKWMKLDSAAYKQPVLMPMSNIDSAAQQQQEENELKEGLKSDHVSYSYRDGIYYHILKEGNGREVHLTDTVEVLYKGWLYSNGKVFDQTDEKPVSFPLNKLIRGWQVGLPGTKVGGKIRLWIPSGGAYGIRTFSTEIPPNSTLVFDIEMVNTRPKN